MSSHQIVNGIKVYNLPEINLKMHLIKGKENLV